jgi:hypothetical protein
MRAVTVVLSLVLIFLALWDVFETVVLPRRVSRPFRFARIFYLSTWGPWKAVGRRIPVGRGREDFLSVYGPLSMLSLLVLWAALLLVPLPPDEVNNWRKSAWQKRAPVAIKHSTAESEGGAKRLG